MTLAVLTAAFVFSTTLSPLDDGPASCKKQSQLSPADVVLSTDIIISCLAISSINHFSSLQEAMFRTRKKRLELCRIQVFPEYNSSRC